MGSRAFCTCADDWKLFHDLNTQIVYFKSASMHWREKYIKAQRTLSVEKFISQNYCHAIVLKISNDDDLAHEAIDRVVCQWEICWLRWVCQCLTVWGIIDTCWEYWSCDHWHVFSTNLTLEFIFGNIPQILESQGMVHNINEVVDSFVLC